MAQLTPHDKAILNCVFNPSLPLNEAYEEELDSDIFGKRFIKQSKILL